MPLCTVPVVASRPTAAPAGKRSRRWSTVVAHVNAVNLPDGAHALTEGATDLPIVYHHPQLPVLPARAS